MSGTRRLKFDEIGYWSEIKLDIVKNYASAYSRILAAQRKPPLHHVYIDAFTGSGVHISKATGEYIPGSPVNALLVQPPFREYHLIDTDRQKLALLRELTKERRDVHIHEGDCNRILLEKVLPNVRYENYRRGLCLLDPYGLQLDWKVIHTAGKMRNCSQHTFQILTKRSERLRSVAAQIDWPPNVWMGVSVEDARVLSRVDDLRRVPAAIRFLSCEPLIGSLAGIDLTDIHWVIVGGESGWRARPMKIEWVREIFRACRKHNVPFFFKQWGGSAKI